MEGENEEKRGAGRGGERLASEEHLLLHAPVTVPVSIRKHLTSYPGNPGRWAVRPPFTAEDTEALSGEVTCPSAEGGWRCTRPYANHGDRYTVVALLGPSP